MNIPKLFKKTGAIAIFFSFLALSCTGSFSRFTHHSTTAKAEDSEPNLVYGEIIIPEQSNYLLIPIGFYQEYKRNSGSLLPSTDFSRVSESARGNPMTVFNLMFHHKQNGDSHLLLSENAIISSFSFIDFDAPNSKPDQKTVNTLMLLEIISEDTNSDEKVNREDAIVAYVADPSGKSVTQITPNNTQLLHWHLDSEQGFILLKVREDSNQDLKFTGQDDTRFIRVKLSDPKIGSDIISDPMRKQINQRL